MIPFHKQLDPNKQAGQIVSPLPKELIIFDAKENVGKTFVEDDYLIYDDEEMDPTK